MTWKLTRYGVFNVGSYYYLLSGPLTDVFPRKSIQCVKVIKMVSFFLWTAAWGGILMINNMVKKGWPLVNWCCLCRCKGETVDHLLIHYELSHVLWSKVFLVSGIQWVMTKTVASFLFAWRDWFGKYLSNILNMVPGFEHVVCGYFGRNTLPIPLKIMRDLQIS